MSRSFSDFSAPFGSFSMGPVTTTRVHRDRDGSRIEETITTRTRTSPTFEPSVFSRTEHIRAPPTTRLQSTRGAGPGVVTSTSEYETGPDGRPSHYSSTVYKSPYGKTYRFNSHF